ncbi:MAG: PQQ-binding-like beta-propeller repeat protein [Bauldia sp.]|nr:PQQ-binding-like beta-propeller repeat protein [Bauldia sp.]
MRSSLGRVLLASASALVIASPAWAQSSAFSDYRPVTNEMLQNPDDGDWLSFRRTQNSWGFSPLAQITPDNITGLDLVWARGMDAGYNATTPLVHDGVMFLPNPNNVIFALDASNGDMLWEYRRTLPEGTVGRNRSIAMYEDKIFTISADNFLVAVDALSGQLVWEVALADPGENPNNAGPLIVNGMVVSGKSCPQAGPPESCYVAAYDTASGEELWRTLTIPSPGDPADESWAGVPYDSRAHVGSWMVPSYDPVTDLIYIGTSVTSPYAKFYFADPEDVDDDYLYQTSTLALDPETGEIVWYFQHMRDQWDLDHPFERVLVDTAVTPNPDAVAWINPNLTPGEERQVLTGIPGKTGLFYSIDRATGEFLWARETIYQTAILDLDPATGRATMNLGEGVGPTAVGQDVEICPGGYGGGKSWHVSSYSPDSNVLFVPLLYHCMVMHVEEDDLQPGPLFLPPGEENNGSIWAINVETGEEVWRYEQTHPVGSVVATASGLLFAGDLNRRFRAFDQSNGDILWETILGGSIVGVPVSYEVDGRQYVSVATGPFPVDPWILEFHPDLQATVGNTLYTFALSE